MLPIITGEIANTTGPAAKKRLSTRFCFKGEGVEHIPHATAATALHAGSLRLSVKMYCCARLLIIHGPATALPLRRTTLCHWQFVQLGLRERIGELNDLVDVQ